MPYKVLYPTNVYSWLFKIIPLSSDKKGYSTDMCSNKVTKFKQILVKFMLNDKLSEFSKIQRQRL